MSDKQSPVMGPLDRPVTRRVYGPDAGPWGLTVCVRSTSECSDVFERAGEGCASVAKGAAVMRRTLQDGQSGPDSRVTR